MITNIEKVRTDAGLDTSYQDGYAIGDNEFVRNLVTNYDSNVNGFGDGPEDTNGLWRKNGD